MRTFFILIIAVAGAWTFHSCKSASGPATFCDTSCLKDTIKFIDQAHPLKPFLYVSAANCNADSIIWSHDDMGRTRKIGLADFVGSSVKINKDAISCFIKDTSYAWLSFNDCSNGRGYLIKIPYSKDQKLSSKTGAINAHDPKFDVAEGLIAYSDRGNLFAEDMATGKTATLTFGQRVEIDYNHVHDFVDSVHVTPTSMWARVKIGNEWKTFSKNVELK